MSIEKDSKGRIKNIGKNSNLTNGHSVCNTCGEDMPGVWDTVCYKCKGTFCYECSVTFGALWYCKEHKPEL